MSKNVVFEMEVRSSTQTLLLLGKVKFGAKNAPPFCFFAKHICANDGGPYITAERRYKAKAVDQAKREASVAVDPGRLHCIRTNCAILMMRLRKMLRDRFTET